jgi:L1 cell adhesion molecule like protein
MVREYFKGKTLNKSVHPDEAVAVGATILAAIISGETNDCVKKIVL